MGKKRSCIDGLKVEGDLVVHSWGDMDWRRTLGCLYVAGDRTHKVEVEREPGRRMAGDERGEQARDEGHSHYQDHGPSNLA